MHERIIALFQDQFGTRPSAIVAVAADGSQRSYVRLFAPGGRTAIGAVGPDRDENRAFLSFSRAFRAIDLPVPEIYAADEDAGVWIEEDLGETTLFDALVDARARTSGLFPAAIVEAYRRVVEILPRFQVEGDRVADYSVAYPHATFDRRSILWDLNYFKYHFLKLAHIPFHEAKLERDFEALADFLLGADASYFLYRDFQSANVMLRDGEPWFIDYQGGRRGALQYDIASLLYDAKADIPQDVRAGLLDHYLDTLERHVPVDRDAFCMRYRGYVLVRIMQAMGAYGYRGFFERKPRFLRSVPYAAGNIRGVLAEGLPIALPELEAAFRRVADEWAHEAAEPEGGQGLAVQVTSFSYKRGYPEDIGGHGGGFVFDCRALPNPGRYPEFAGRCGLDAPVAAYLEEQPALGPYWDSVRGLAENQIEAYLARGFTSLSIAFGCTGGQHRSVYLAERLGRYMRERFPQIAVRVLHREAPFWPREVPAHAAAPAARVAEPGPSAPADPRPSAPAAAG